MPLTREILSRCRAVTLVASKIAQGNCIRLALDLGFLSVHAIESDPGLVQEARQAFRSSPQVHIYEGDSAKLLPGILEHCSGHLVVWLDNHPLDSILTPDNTLLLAELHCLARYAKLNRITVMVDDIRLFSPELLQRAIGVINAEFPDGYDVKFIDNHIATGDIMLVRGP